MAEKKTKKKTTKKKAAPKKSAEALFAVIETGGKQYKVSEGDIIPIEKLSEELEEGDKITFGQILLRDDGSKTDIGNPLVKGAKVEGSLHKEGRKDKIEVIRFRSKSRHFKKRGHKQPYMAVKIEKIH